MSPRREWRVAVLPGDGIGPEVTSAALTVLRALGADGPRLEPTEFPWPATAYHREHRRMMPEDWREQLSRFDAILLGALGDPGPADDPERYRLSDGVSLSPLLEIRRGFDQWACERPARWIEGAPQFLADPRAREVHMLVIRENSEGEYVGQGGRLGPGTPHEVATQVSVFTRFGAERIIRHAFGQARRRAAAREAGTLPRRSFDNGRAASQVCLITKRNALRHWGELYTEVFGELAREYPDVATHHELVDAACMKFVTSPWLFDVVVGSNLHGDILTDLAAVLCGGMGVAPSCNLNPSDRRRPPMFEPTHGSAPDIAGRNRAGPAAMILTAASMLDWMGEEDPAAADGARRMRAAMEAELKASAAAARGTRETAEAVARRLQEGAGR